MKFQDCFLFRPNLMHIPVAEFNGSEYVGRMALFVPQSDNYHRLSIGGREAKIGDLMLIRLWDESYNKKDRGQFKVGPIWAVDPKDFRDSVDIENVYIIPAKKEELVAEYNRLVEACEMLDTRIAWMETLGKESFSENEFRLDEIIEELNVDLTEENDTKVRNILKANIKF